MATVFLYTAMYMHTNETIIIKADLIQMYIKEKDATRHD